MTDAPARTTGDVYAAYEAVVRKVEQWVRAVNPRVPGCDERHVRARFVQRFIEISEADLTRQLRAGPLPRFCTAGGLSIDTETGRVRVTPRLFLANVGLFFAAWAVGLWSVGRTLASGAPSRPGTVTILMESGGGVERTDARFAEFCRKGPIVPLCSAATVVIQALQPPQETTDPRLVYSRRPLLGIAQHVLSLGARLALFGALLYAPWLYLRVLAGGLVTVLIGRDIAWVPAFQWLDRNRVIDAVVATTSFFMAQPLWMIGVAGQQFRLHFVWYSQNFIPKMYVGDTARPDLPAARHIRCHEHWVWTEGFKQYLRQVGSEATVHVVGPLVWYLPAPVEGIAQTDASGQRTINLAVFDVTPLPDGVTAFGAAKNYYTFRCISQFVIDIVDVAERVSQSSGLRMRIHLKHKRAPRKGRHDFAYVDLLEDLATRYPWFQLVEHNTNLFGLLEQCDASISVPYTSTAYVSAHLGQPAIYYDALGELVPQFEPHPCVHFASSRDALEALIRESVETCQKSS